MWREALRNLVYLSISLAFNIVQSRLSKNICWMNDWKGQENGSFPTYVTLVTWTPKQLILCIKSCKSCLKRVAVYFWPTSVSTRPKMSPENKVGNWRCAPFLTLSQSIFSQSIPVYRDVTLLPIKGTFNITTPKRENWITTSISEVGLSSIPI